VKQKILFIINPISGGKDKKKIPALIDTYLDKAKFDYRISFTERVEHAYMLSKAALKEGYHIVVAVGGDGTVNEVAKGIVHTETILGIIPFGSGNGLARTLKIPLKSIGAIKNINNNYYTRIDSAKLNDRMFFNMAGSGFDAEISNEFAGDKKRGLLGYVRAAFQQIRNYKSKQYQLNIDGKIINRKAFILSIANSSQYGNDAHIAPHADVKDGILDIVIVKPFHFIKLPLLAMYMFTNNADKSSYIEYFKGKKILIEREYADAIHLDGEPCFEQKELNIEVLPLSLNVIVPNYV
jgi:diacylglycerol kinase (ATP)